MVIGDFGISKIGKDIISNDIGTPLNKAPELMCDEKCDISKSDIWSIGVVFYRLLFGEYPFFG